MAIGLDVGTHMLIKAKNVDGKIEYTDQVDAFFTVDADDQTRDMLESLSIPFTEKRGKISVLGEDARNFANMFKKDTRRPMQTGCLNKQDVEALGMLTALLGNVLGEGSNEPLVYSVTSQPLGTEVSFDYHKAQVESILKDLSYDPKPIQEARAIALAELASNRFTGLAISCGSGTTTVWLGLLGMDNPNFQFSINRGGDWIDSNAAENFAGLTRTKVQTVKERGIRITEAFSNEIANTLEGNKLVEYQARQALSVYYREYIRSVIKGIKFKLEKEQLPEFDGPIPVVLAGGTSAPEDFVKVFEEEWKAAKVGLEVSGFTRAQDPFHTVAKGCLVAAELEARKRSK
ncbi:MAG: hypothetical protein PHY47_00165 [Lachnospiraceae bacterium]|nr:hypothetical protein [Lachnospiraceae bacterium]